MSDKKEIVENLEQDGQKELDQEKKLKDIISGNPMIYTHINFNS